MGDVPAQDDPHCWYDPKNGLLMAQAATERLMALDPDHSNSYRSNFSSFLQCLTDKMKAWQTCETRGYFLMAA